MKRRVLLAEAQLHSQSLDDVQLTAHQKSRIKIPWILRKVFSYCCFIALFLLSYCCFFGCLLALSNPYFLLPYSPACSQSPACLNSSVKSQTAAPLPPQPLLAPFLTPSQPPFGFPPFYPDFISISTTISVR